MRPTRARWGRPASTSSPSFGIQTGQYIQNAPGVSRQVIPVSTRTLDVRLFTAPLHPDAKTNFTDAFTVGQSWGSGRSAPTMLLNLGLNRVMPSNGSLGLNYTWRYDPLFSQLGTDPTGGGLLGTVYHSPTQQRLSLNYARAARPALRPQLQRRLRPAAGRHQSVLQHDVPPGRQLGPGPGDRSTTATSATATVRRELSLSRRILGRDLAFTYSTLTKKLRFNIAGTTF